MRKKLFIAAAALVALASCTNEENIGVVSLPEPAPSTTSDAIVFSSAFKGVTRAEHVGADAANLLNKKFIVGGFKSSGADVTTTTVATGTVFDNYNVNWLENSAATTESNTSDWEYVGYNAEEPSGIAGKRQSIKYWDYSFDQYDFIAYSTGAATVTATGTAAAAISAGKVLVTSINPVNARTNAYQLSGKTVDLAKCYIADMVTVYKDGTGGKNYKDEVLLTFRNLASKVRVALYETVPGYSVKDVKFYTNDSRTIAEGADENQFNLFTTADTDKDNFYTEGTYTVYFPTIGKANKDETDYNKAHVGFVASGKEPGMIFGLLNLVGPDYNEASGTNYIGRSSTTPSFAGEAANNYYLTVLPNEEGTVLELRVDYTLLSNDGSGEEIKIHGAKAFVPAIYAAWKPNYAYTYLFKISDNTNGWTSTVETDPSGLYPITFDAVVLETEDNTQSTITTVSTPSITTYQLGHVYSESDEYKTGDIYVQVMKDGSILPLNTSTHPVQAWKVTGNANHIDVTEAAIMDALNIRTAYTSSETTGRNGITLTKVSTEDDITAIPGADGNDITVGVGEAAMFNAANAGTYAFTYKGTDHNNSYYYSAVVLTSEPGDWASGVWFKDPDGTDPVGAYADGTYYKRYTSRNIDWAVKVIKVE